MKNIIHLKGVIEFDPIDLTNKHIKQSAWKKIAIVNIDSDICEYYSWFLKKRFNLPLMTPFRKSHVTLVNDRESETNGKWEEVKAKWDGKEIDIYLHVDPFLGIKNRMGNYVDWWLTVPYEYRDELGSIRMELGLPARPYFEFHMTIGTAINFYPRHEVGINAIKAKGMFEEYSEYILKLAQDDLLNLGKMPEHEKKAN